MPPVPRKYCGKRAQLPPGYTRRGTRYECLQTGFGVATALCRQQPRQVIVPLTFITIFMVLTSLLLIFVIIGIFRKPVNKTNEQDKKLIDEKTF
jgi:hypothetical protein